MVNGYIDMFYQIILTDPDNII